MALVHLLHGQPEAVEREAVSLVRQAAELIEEEAGQGRVAAPLGDAQGDEGVDGLDRRSARNTVPPAVEARVPVLDPAVVLVLDVPDELFSRIG